MQNIKQRNKVRIKKSKQKIKSQIGRKTQN